MSDNVINFPQRPGSADEKIPVKELLEELLKVEDTFESILVCGFSKTGVFYYISSEGDLKENAWILENAKISLQDLILNPEE
jgi:hypothetical protein